MANKKIKIFSFFSGCGFLDLGFEKNGYEIVLVNEFFKPFLDAYKYARLINFCESIPCINSKYLISRKEYVLHIMFAFIDMLMIS